MTIFVLIHEQDTDNAWGCNVMLFTDKQAASTTMREDWQEAVKAWNYDSTEHKNEDECVCHEASAVIRIGDNMESWHIEEHNLDVQVAVEVKGGLVQNIYANADVSPDVYDLDVSSFHDEAEVEEADQKEAELCELIKSPGWRNVW